MTTHQEIRIIDQLNRTVIAVLSLTGMLLDGVELADLVLQAAVILWLWMREFRTLERALVGYLQPRRLRSPALAAGADASGGVG